MKTLGEGGLKLIYMKVVGMFHMIEPSLLDFLVRTLFYASLILLNLIKSFGLVKYPYTKEFT